jgi:acid phosphatase type 7
MSEIPPPTTLPPAPDPDPAGPGDRGRSTGQFAVLALVVVGLIILLSALAIVIRGDPGADPVSAGETPSGMASASQSPSPTGTTSPTAGPTSAPSEPSSSPSASLGLAAVLVGAGDIGDCDTREDSMTAALLDDIDGTVFTAGDNAYENGTAKEYSTCYDDTWGRHKERTRPAAGNHDWHTADLAGYFGYFGDAARGPDGDPWYSFDLGTWHVIVLDSECNKNGGCEADSAQGRWLASDLAASDARCSVAIWHKPRFSSGEHGNDRSVGPFWTALHDAGVDVVVNGHDHDYERFAPQDPDGAEDRDRGMREFVVGTGGTPLRPFNDPVANSELRAITHGVFKLTLRDGSYDWAFIPVSGAFRDGGTAFCH